jgi:hypothetical protein
MESEGRSIVGSNLPGISTASRVASWHAGGQMMKKVPKDPWGYAYQYRYPGKKDPAPFDLFSLGKDGVADTADDIQVPKAEKMAK